MFDEDHRKEIEALGFLDATVSLGRPPVPFWGAWADRALIEAEMAKISVGQAAVYHVMSKAYDANFGNDLLMEELVGSTNLIPTWALVPSEIAMDCAPLRFADKLAQQGVKAVRMFPSSTSQPAVATRYAFYKWVYGEYLSVLQERGIIVFLEFSPHRRSEPEWDKIYAVATEFPRLNIVLGDSFQRTTVSLVSLMRVCLNLHLLTTGLDINRHLEYLVGQLGAHRFLSGSKFPVNTMGTMVGQVSLSRLSWEQKKLVAGGNARRLMGIPEGEKAP